MRPARGGGSEERRTRLRQRLKRLTRPAWLGTLRRTRPLSNNWGLDRGRPVDRYYIERFLGEHRQDIRGRALEVGDSGYLERFGAGVKQRDVLDYDPKNPRATIVADLGAPDAVPAGLFDCFVLTQTLQFIPDTRTALANARRLLTPGGVLLATVPSVSRIPAPPGLQVDHWRFTVASCLLLFGAAFGREQVAVRSYGNVLTSIAFLAGMACDELSHRELEVSDPYFPLIIAVRAVNT